MQNVSFLLFFEFIKIGLFTFGGGYASLPFLYRISEIYNWYSYSELTQMIAISGLTPGPIGLNMSTFAGFKTLGITGAIVAGVGLILPMFIITTQVFRIYRKFSDNKYVNSILYFLRPTSCALITYVGYKLVYSLILKNSFSIANIDLKALFILLILFICTLKIGRNPVKYMAIGACISLLINYIKL